VRDERGNQGRGDERRQDQPEEHRVDVEEPIIEASRSVTEDPPRCDVREALEQDAPRPESVTKQRRQSRGRTAGSQ
jgi:hypothetical protein